MALDRLDARLLARGRGVIQAAAAGRGHVWASRRALAVAFWARFLSFEQNMPPFLAMVERAANLGLFQELVAQLQTTYRIGLEQALLVVGVRLHDDEPDSCPSGQDRPYCLFDPGARPADVQCTWAQFVTGREDLRTVARESADLLEASGYQQYAALADAVAQMLTPGLQTSPFCFLADFVLAVIELRNAGHLLHTSSDPAPEPQVRLALATDLLNRLAREQKEEIAPGVPLVYEVFKHPDPQW